MYERTAGIWTTNELKKYVVVNRMDGARPEKYVTQFKIILEGNPGLNGIIHARKRRYLGASSYILASSQMAAASVLS